MAKHKVQGFNSKEQKIFNRLLDGEPHNIRELKKLFWKDAESRCAETYEPGWGEKEIDAQAQSYVRNSIRRLVRDGWVEQCSRGTYQLTKSGKKKVSKGVDTTESFGSSMRGKYNRKKKTAKKPRRIKKKPGTAKAKAKETKVVKAKAKETKVVKAKVVKAKAKKTKVIKAKKLKKTGSKKNGVSLDKVKDMRRKVKIAAATEKFQEQED
jgi:hypothetical protein